MYKMFCYVECTKCFVAWNVQNVLMRGMYRMFCCVGFNAWNVQNVLLRGMYRMFCYVECTECFVARDLMRGVYIMFCCREKPNLKKKHSLFNFIAFSTRPPHTEKKQK